MVCAFSGLTALLARDLLIPQRFFFGSAYLLLELLFALCPFSFLFFQGLDFFLGLAELLLKLSDLLLQLIDLAFCRLLFLLEPLP